MDPAVREDVAEALRASEERFELAFNDGQIGMALVALDGAWLRVNPTLCRIVGYSEDALLRGAVQDITHPEDLDKDLDHMAEMIRGERVRYEMEKRYVRGDGALAWVRLSVSMATDAAGAPAYFISQVQDITEHRRQERRLRDSAREHAALHRVSEAVAHDIGEEALWALVAREAAGLFAVETAIVVRFVGRHGVVVGAHGHHFGLGTRLPTTGPGALAQVARTHAGARIDAYEELGVGSRLRDQALKMGLVASVAAPVMVEAEPWGALLVSTAEHAGFAGDAAGRLARFAELVALGIANAQARSELLSRAMTDALTGLANHREFHERLAARWPAPSATGRHLSLVLMDLDHFKQVNDIHGHQAGDLVLRETAERLRAVAREGEIIGRVGGEEFAWILPGATAIQAHAAAERAREAVRDTPFAEHRAPDRLVRRVRPRRRRGPSELFRLADSALYAAKSQGRDPR